MGEEYAWLVEALASIAQACGWPEARRHEIAALSDRLQHGVRADALTLARMRVRGLGRTLVRRLVAAGLADADALRSAGDEVVRRAINHKGAFAALWAKLSKAAPQPAPTPYPAAADAPEATPVAAEPSMDYGEGRPAPAAPSAAGPPPPTPTVEPPATASAAIDQPVAGAAAAAPAPVLLVDLRERRVAFHGRSIPTKPPNNLQRQPLLALAVLAESPGKTLTMADLAEGMHRLGGLQKRPVAPDARDLRYKILRPIRKVFADAPDLRCEIERLVENVPGVGLRLFLPDMR